MNTIITFDTYLLTSYLSDLANNNKLSPHTRLAYRCDINNFINWLDKESYTIITSKEINKYFSLLGTVYKTSTIKRKYISLNKFFQEYSILSNQENPFETINLKLPKHKTLPKTVLSIVS